MAPFDLLKKQAETMFQLICCERKTLFQLKKTDYKKSEHDLYKKFTRGKHFSHIFKWRFKIALNMVDNVRLTLSVGDDKL